MKVLCVTHSSRPFFEARASLNALERRFKANRFEQLPPFESLPGVDTAVPFSGGLSLWRIDEQKNYHLEFLRMYNPGYKIQFATFHNDCLLVYGADRLEVLDTKFQVVKTITDPWLAGGHTVFVDKAGYAWVTSAPANAVLKIDLDQGQVIERITIPERYGRSYNLSPKDNLLQHYVSTDLQPTHVNCAYPLKNGLLVTLLIPGVVGFFDQTRNYREIAHGFRGCHSAKPVGDSNEIYLTDSPSGLVWFFNFETGSITGRFHIESNWLHDADQITGSIFAVALGDENEVQIFDKSTGEVLQRVDCSRFGQSVMFINTCEVSQPWQKVLQPETLPVQPIDLSQLSLGFNMVPPLANRNQWLLNTETKTKAGLLLQSEQSLNYEYLLTGTELHLPCGDYAFEGEIVCHKGAIALGLVDQVSDKWISTLTFDSVNSFRREILSLVEPATLKVILTAANLPNELRTVSAEVQKVSLRKIAISSQNSEEQLGWDQDSNNPANGLNTNFSDFEVSQAYLKLAKEQTQLEGEHNMLQQRFEEVIMEVQHLEESRFWKLWVTWNNLKAHLRSIMLS